MPSSRAKQRIPGATGSDADPANAVPPEEALWALFTRSVEGWTGGDCTNSIPLPDGRVLWLFSDTYLGPVNPDRTRPESTAMIHNSLVVQDGETLTTIHGGSRGAPRALFSPTDGASWYWLNDGTVEDDVVRLFLLKFLRHGPEGWAWSWIGTDVATLRLPSLAVERIVPLPNSNGIRYGSAILETADFTYIYGVEDLRYTKYAHVARARRGNLLGPWEYFDGRAWTDRATATARLLPASVGTEFSVIETAGGYALITFDTSCALWEWREIVAFFAPDPAGPWTDRTVLYTTPETGQGNCFVYNAHAHQEFAQPGEAVLSYNVNSLQFGDLYADADLNRARFVRVPLPGVRQSAQVAVDDGAINDRR